MPKNWNRLPTGLVPPGTVPACARPEDYLRYLVKQLS